ncbi:MAG: bifunctional homocysteine S-methyltransferase/methylenetetrahydrofolate reductase [Victivallales bacterium]|nr:bifunctional homocysteine S-methyltransferase/methylenetetrahydrofolate reductase [Victivallales bacterium]
MTLNLSQILQERLLVFDGAMGTELYARHVFTNRSYDEVCLSTPKLVSAIHEDYVKAGADVLTTNSFGANAISLKQFGLMDKAKQINLAAAQLARAAADGCKDRKILVAGSIGPIFTLTGTRETRIQALADQAKALLEGGVDFIIFETLPSRDTAMEASMAMQGIDAPFVLSFSIPEEGDLAAVVRQRLAWWSLNPFQVPKAFLRDLGVNETAHSDYVRKHLHQNDQKGQEDVTDLGNTTHPPFEGLPQPAALGLNCGTGPDTMLTALEHAVKVTSLPLIVQPNAGVPRMRDGRQLYLCSPEYLFTYAQRYISLGARAIGGCCGTTPAHIAELARALKPFAKALHNAPVIQVKEDGAAMVPEKPLAERSKLGYKLANHQWITTVELTPPNSWQTDKVIEKAILCREHDIDTLNIPDGPRASPRLSALVTGMLVQQQAGIEAVVHICGRDRNMIALQSDMLGAAACGLRNFLLITGDPPKLGNYSFASGVFDTDSIGLVRLQKHLNGGIDLGGQPVKPATEAVVGVGADPNALDFDREVSRTREKVAAGADYITTQPVFDPQALFRFMDAISDLNIPVLAGIWPLVSYRNAEFMRNEVPGVVVPDAIMKRMAEASNDEQLATGVKIAQEAIEAVRSRVAGVQVSAPFGRVQVAFDVLQK